MVIKYPYQTFLVAEYFLTRPTGRLDGQNGLEAIEEVVYFFFR